MASSPYLLPMRLAPYHCHPCQAWVGQCYTHAIEDVPSFENWQSSKSSLMTLEFTSLPRGSRSLCSRIDVLPKGVSGNGWRLVREQEAKVPELGI